MKLYKNIDVVQINIKEGVREYYLPKNVDWADQVIEKIVVYATGHDMDEYSPVDGVTPIITRELCGDVYLNLYANDESEIVTNLNAQNILYTNNNPIEINSKLSLKLSRIFFAETSPADGCILLYVYYGSVELEDYDIPKHSVTVQFNLEPGETPLSDVIDTYIHAQSARLKGIEYWGILTQGAGQFLTLRNRDYKTIVNRLPVNFCRPPMGVEFMETGDPIKAELVQINPFYLDCEDIDFANSTIQNTYYSSLEPIKVILTFLY